MRVLLLTTHLNIGGISTYTIALAKALKSKGMTVFVASNGGVMVSELAKEGVSHIKIDVLTKSELSPKVFKALFEIFRLVKKLDIDIIHSQTRITQVIGFFVSKLSGAGFVTTCHGFFTRNIGRVLLPSWGSQVIAISDAVKDHLIKDFGINKDNISLIYNGIEVKKFLKDFTIDQRDMLKDKFGVRRDCDIIGTIARFTPDKGHDILLYGLYEILKIKPNVQLVFVGDGKEKARIMDIVNRLGLLDKVVFINPQINTVNVLAIMDVFMFTPSRKEGLGLVLLEALASGKPVVATDVGGISSVVKNDVNGFLVPPLRPELLVEPTLRLLKDNALYKRMSQSGIETVVNKFSIDGMVERVMDVYMFKARPCNLARPRLEHGE